MNPEINGSITFFYYNDLANASKFYEEVMGFEKVIDVEFAHVFKIYDEVHVGLVDGSTGSMKPSDHKSVMLSMYVADVDEWCSLLRERGWDVPEPIEPDYLDMRVLIFKDPEGYSIELLQWLVKPYG